jgi:hypothetical protein
MRGVAGIAGIALLIGTSIPGHLGGILAPQASHGTATQFSVRRVPSSDSRPAPQALSVSATPVGPDTNSAAAARRTLRGRGIAATAASITWYVSSTGSDSNDCLTPSSACRTIGAAISKAASGDAIDVASGTYPEHLTVGKDLAISGTGAGQTIIDGGGNGAVLSVYAFTIVNVAGVTIQHGSAGIANAGALTVTNSNIINDNGVGATNTHGMLSLTNCQVSSNTDGGISNTDGTIMIQGCEINANTSPGIAGGIFNTGIVNISSSTIDGNAAMGYNGSLGGGILSDSGTVTIANSVISSNRSTAFYDSGGGLANSSGSTIAITNSSIDNNQAGMGGGIANSGTLILYASTLSGNSATNGGGGGIENDSPGTAALSNSTVSGNSAGSGGGLGNSGMLALASTTISSNSAGSGGGIANGGTVRLEDTVIGANVISSPGGRGPDCTGALTSEGYNLLSDNDSCTGLTNGTNGDLVGTVTNHLEPRLGPLQNNGGPTYTMALLPDSPAIDAGNPNGCTDAQGNPLTTDQRGYPRPSPLGGRCALRTGLEPDQPAPDADYRDQRLHAVDGCVAKQRRQPGGDLLAE